jgi:putative ABC transport system permease protein
VSLSVGFRIAFRALGRNKLETILAMLGMTIGVGAVLTTMALGSGAQASIEEQVMAAGLNVIVVTAGNYKAKGDNDESGVVAHQGDARPQDPLPPGVTDPWQDDLRPAVTAGPQREPGFGAEPRVRLVLFHPEDDPMAKHDHPTAAQRLGDIEAGLGAAATLTRADAAAIKAMPGVQYVAAGVHDNSHIVAGTKRWFTRYHGTDLELPLIHRSWAFPHGRFFNQQELDSSAQVMVLGSVVSDRLFGPGEDPVGQTVTLWNQKFNVVGEVANTSWATPAGAGDDQFDAVYIPVTTIDKLLDLTKLNTITITALSSGDVTNLSMQITKLLRARHKITDKMPDDFTVSTQARAAVTRGLNPRVARALSGNVSNFDQITLEQLARTLQRASRTMTTLLASIAAVSLIVGGIGIMNIMLLSVTERTREIGVRMAVGARGRDVLLQFVAEAVALSLIGGLIGVAIGFAASSGLTRFLHWSTIVTSGGVLVAFGIAAIVGIFFGIYPARQAARLDPIDALRYE